MPVPYLPMTCDRLLITAVQALQSSLVQRTMFGTQHSNFYRLSPAHNEIDRPDTIDSKQDSLTSVLLHTDKFTLETSCIAPQVQYERTNHMQHSLSRLVIVQSC